MIKKTFIAFIISIFIMFPVHNTHAGYWGENFAANAVKQMLEEISTEIANAINASAKMASIKQATSMIESLLYGGSSSQRNISNYYDFLIEKPREETVLYTQDFLTQTLRGTTSGDYIPTGGSGSNGLGESLSQAGKTVIDGWEGKNVPVVDYQNYCPASSDFFADGNFQCFSAIMSNPVNTPIGIALATDQVAAAKYAQTQAQAEIEATSSGVLADKDENGNIKLPSSVVEEIQLQQITLPLEALATGDTGVFSNMIQSFAVGLVVGVVERGLGEVEESIDKNTAAFEKQYNEQYNNMKQDIGPALEYTGSSYNNAQKMQ